MTPKPLDILRKGLKSLQNKVAVKRDHLLSRLADKKSITSSDEHWLDNDANLIDEERILDALENASDYERGVERLDDNGKALQAISLITDYIDTINDPIAPKLEGRLGSFSRQICLERSRGMKETIITDYFHHP